MSCENEYNPGTKMILVREGVGVNSPSPIQVEVERTTKTQILVRDPKRPDDPKASLRFEKKAWVDFDSLVRHSVAGNRVTRRFDSSKLYDHTEHAMSILKTRYEKQRQLRQERRDAEAERRRKIVEERAAELAEVKGLCHGRLLSITKSTQVMPDGQRVYLLEVPVRSDHFERKRGWELVLVRCKDVEELDWDAWTEWRREHRGQEITEEATERGRKECTVTKVEYAFTYCNGSSSSFASVSTSKADDDEKALWEAVRNVYTSW